MGSLAGVIVSGLISVKQRTEVPHTRHPSAFRETLHDINVVSLAKYVLENGTADDDKLYSTDHIEDLARIAYLQAYAGAMQEVVSAGADVRGSLHRRCSIISSGLQAICNDLASSVSIMLANDASPRLPHGGMRISSRERGVQVASTAKLPVDGLAAKGEQWLKYRRPAVRCWLPLGSP